MRRVTSIFILWIGAIHGAIAGGQIALTFDDSPRIESIYFSGMERSQLLLAQLKEAKVKTVFFSNSATLDIASGRERLQLYGEAGHLIANHTHTHSHLYATGAKPFIDDIVVADRALSSFPTFVRWFRYPYLYKGYNLEETREVRAALEKMKYRHGYITVNTFDWYMEKLFLDAVRTGKQIDFDRLKQVYVETIWDAILFYDDLAQKTLKRSPRHVLLLHETDLAAMFTLDLVRKIRSEGWKIISPETAYRDPIADNYPDIVNNGGHLERIAVSLGYTGPVQHIAEDRLYLEERFNKEVYRQNTEKP